METAKITLYTSDEPLCQRVKSLLDARGLPYDEIVIHTEAERAAMVAKTGYQHCPLVYVGDEFIGGFPETLEADRSGRLAELVGR
jgi:glutaredoxin 3